MACAAKGREEGRREPGALGLEPIYPSHCCVASQVPPLPLYMKMRRRTISEALPARR